MKEGKYSSKLEVVVRKSTELHSSPKKFNVEPSMFNKLDDLVTVEELPKLSNYQRVSVRVKVLVQEEEKKGLLKQEYIIADATGSCKIVAWNANTGVMQSGNSYMLSGLMVRVYKGKSIYQFLRTTLRCLVLKTLELWKIVSNKLSRS